MKSWGNRPSHAFAQAISRLNLLVELLGRRLRVAASALRPVTFTPSFTRTCNRSKHITHATTTRCHSPKHAVLVASPTLNRSHSACSHPTTACTARDLRVRPSELTRECPGRRPRLLSKSKIHIKLGPPDRVIVEQAKQLDANLVVVGNSHRSGLAAMLHGNTAEKILDKLDCNVLAMP